MGADLDAPQKGDRSSPFWAETRKRLSYFKIVQAIERESHSGRSSRAALQLAFVRVNLNQPNRCLSFREGYPQGEIGISRSRLKR